MTYTQAFDSMFNVIRKEYAFNGIQGKQPEWDAVYAEIAPRVQAAQDAGDPYAYYLALRDFMLKFKDGHVSLDGGQFAGTYNEDNILGGWGFAVRQLDDGRVIVVTVIPGYAGSPGRHAGRRRAHPVQWAAGPAGASKCQTLPAAIHRFWTAEGTHGFSYARRDRRNDLGGIPESQPAQPDRPDDLHL